MRIRSLLPWCGAAVLGIVLALLVAPHGAAAAQPPGLEQLLPLMGPGIPFLFGSVRGVRGPLSLNELERLADPGAEDIESFPYTLWDIQNFPAAGVQNLNFFTGAPATPTQGNIDAAGQITSPKWFQIYGVSVSFLQTAPSNRAVTAAPADQVGNMQDITLIIYGQQAVLNITISDKKYGPIPVEQCHALGGPMGGVTQGITAAAAAVGAHQFAVNGPVDGGFWYNGEVVIPPNTGFQVSLNLLAAQAISVQTAVRVAFTGRIYRRVL